MKKIILILLVVSSKAAYSSCELDEYKRYLNLQSLIMLESSIELFNEDKMKFKAIKPFVKFQVRHNNLKIYVAQKINSIDPSILNKKGPTARLLPSFPLKITTDGSVENKIDIALINDSFYQSEKKVMAPLEMAISFS